MDGRRGENERELRSPERVMLTTCVRVCWDKTEAAVCTLRAGDYGACECDYTLGPSTGTAGGPVCEGFSRSPSVCVYACMCVCPLKPISCNSALSLSLPQEFEL